ncbi:NAD(P)H-quinone oxidoreductase [Aquibacillus sp. 3ASR75-11]|uniref:NAD(P)H-quinone oxidoreductase n=1 Tax=Terrihalobacillus insolitus TaxID=2950438 RepID=A0A9X3WVD3_9BACI|nr:NAD(P)H-quinone oxidoreductase [Terrihalobacillus insolitus]MDC3415266.1 NAD(P)H-quinone oxidoreductase [Terrihalobacillus insolitus]MDC3426365.1 NAD(P)H-quinone oxidoreductase [Terrihalobacillus insolitus]
MKAITVKQPGGVDQLQMVDQPKPSVMSDELLIKVCYAGVNRTDILSRQRGPSYLANPVLGIEVAGVVEEVGSDSGVEVGTRVMGLVNGGGYAEYAVMPADRAMVVPDNLSLEEAAAIPEVFLTAYQTLFWLGELGEKESVLIHAGGSGVGTAAIQLSKQLVDAKVLTTAGSERKLVFCRSLGADVTINYKEQAFDQEVLKATENKGVDVILDFVGASYFKRNMASVALDGRWILIGLLGGAEVEKLNLMEIMQKRVQLKGTLLTPRTDDYKALLTNEFAEATLPLFKAGKLKPIVDQVFDLKNVGEAHLHMENNKNIGKILLKIDSVSGS